MQLKLEKGVYDPGSIEKKPLCPQSKVSLTLKSTETVWINQAKKYVLKKVLYIELPRAEQYEGFYN